ncbi:MAG: MerR family transcriptional regulator [Mycobacterium sp.]|nr:MerR family transcriptional regulator [Mycobacterium sp.]
MDVHIGAAARQSGISVDAIRYYESLGLIEGGRRDSVGRRVFTSDDVRWLVFLRTMRETGMPIADLQEYVRYRRAGAAGVDGVLAVLHRHQHNITQQQVRLSDCAALIDVKIAKYRDLAQTGRPPGQPEVDLE